MQPTSLQRGSSDSCSSNAYYEEEGEEDHHQDEEQLTQTLQTELENLRAQTRQALESSWAEVERLQREGAESSDRVRELEQELGHLRNAAREVVLEEQDGTSADYDSVSSDEEEDDTDDSIGGASGNKSIVDNEKLAAIATAVAAQFGGGIDMDTTSNSEDEMARTQRRGSRGPIQAQRRSSGRPTRRKSNPRIVGDDTDTTNSRKRVDYSQRKSFSGLSMPKTQTAPRRKSGGALTAAAATAAAAAFTTLGGNDSKGGGIIRSNMRRMSSYGRLQGASTNDSAGSSRTQQSRHSSMPGNQGSTGHNDYNHHHDMISQLASLENDKRIMVEELESKLQSKELAIETLENRTEVQEQTILDLQAELDAIKQKTEEKERAALSEMEDIKHEIETNETKTMDLERQVQEAERTLQSRKEKEASLKNEIMVIEERIRKTDEQSASYISDLEEKLRKANASRAKYEEENHKMKQKTDEALQNLRQDLLEFLPREKGEVLIMELMNEFESLREKEEMLSEVLVARMQERQETIAALERMSQVQKRVDGSMASVNQMLTAFQENLDAMKLNDQSDTEDQGTTNVNRGNYHHSDEGGVTDDRDNDEDDEEEELDDGKDDVSSTNGVLHMIPSPQSKSVPKSSSPCSSGSTSETATQRQDVAVAGLEKVLLVQEQVQRALKLVEEELMDRLASLDWNNDEGGADGGNGGGGGGAWPRKPSSSAPGGMKDIMEKAEQIQDEAKEQLQEIHEEMSARLAEIEGYQNARNGILSSDKVGSRNDGRGEGGTAGTSGGQQQMDEDILNDKDLDRLEAELEEKDASVAELQDATSKQESTVKELRAELEKLQANTKEESRASLEVMEKLQGEVRMIVERVAEKDRMIASLTNVLNQRKTSEAELERELDRLKNEAKALETCFPEDLGHVGL